MKVIVNASTRIKGYWDNQIEDNLFVLTTHCAAALRLAEAAAQDQDIFLYIKEDRISYRGPIRLQNWQRINDFFKLRFSNFDSPGNLGLKNRQDMARIERQLSQGNHIILYTPNNLSTINLETKQPKPKEVEDVLNNLNDRIKDNNQAQKIGA